MRVFFGWCFFVCVLWFFSFFFFFQFFFSCGKTEVRSGLLHMATLHGRPSLTSEDEFGSQSPPAYRLPAFCSSGLPPLRSQWYKYWRRARPPHLSNIHWGTPLNPVEAYSGDIPKNALLVAGNLFQICIILAQLRI